MLGKKQFRQTKMIGPEDVKQAGLIKDSAPKKQPNSLNPNNRTVKKPRTDSVHGERSAERHGQLTTKDKKQVDLPSNEGDTSVDYNDCKPEFNGDKNLVDQGKSKKVNSVTDSASEIYPPPVPRQGLWKQPVDSRQHKHPSGSVTNEETELQRVPGQFESVEEYVSVFEPLLFDECWAQLYSTWEESAETPTRDAHVMVRIKGVERRERGVVLAPSTTATNSGVVYAASLTENPRSITHGGTYSYGESSNSVTGVYGDRPIH